MLMRRTLLISGLLLLVIILEAQSDSLQYEFKNSADRLITNDRRLTIGGYGEVHYNQPLSSDTKNNGTLDVHRVVLLVGYKFSDRVQFVTEIEFEHVIVKTPEDARAHRHIGSPTVQINDLDIEPEARNIQQFGVT